jgi:hypothetical protein
MSNESLQAVRDRLMAWGEWSRHGADIQLGYPSRAPHLAERSGAHTDQFIQPRSIAETDRALLQLRGAHPLMYAVLNQEYFWQSSVEAGARRLRISPATYKNRRAMAEYWMDSRLECTPIKKYLIG